MPPRERMRRFFGEERRPLFRTLPERPANPWLSFLRTAALRKFKRQLSLRKRFVDELRKEIQHLEGVLDSREADGYTSQDYSTTGEYTDDAESADDEGYSTTGNYSDTSAGKSSARLAVRSATKPSAAPRSRRQQVLFQTFAAMEGEKSEFTTDGKPKVTEVNDRLESLGHDASDRAEIDSAYDEYLASGQSRTNGRKLTAREKTLFQIFDQMQGEKSEFTGDGRPQVGAVNDRLESLGQEQSSRDEIDRVYKKYSG